MTKTEQERERRKLAILRTFVRGESLYTNQLAKALNVTWPVADRLLRELVDEGELHGDKIDGYTLCGEPAKPTRWESLKRLLRVSHS